MPPSPFVWYELMTSDLGGAERFYAAVSGWRARDAGMPGWRYTLLSAAGADVAGAMQTPADAAADGARPAWFGYVGVADVDAAAAALEAAGGRIHRAPADIPGVGRFSMVADPHGAVFAIFTPRPSETSPARPEPGTAGTIGWHELMAGESEAALAFYAGLFHWTDGGAIDVGPMGIYRIFAIGDQPAGGMMTKPQDCPRPFWLYYINVDDIEAAADRVRHNGGTVLMGPHPVPGGSRIVQARDPQGAMFALVQPAVNSPIPSDT